MDCLELIMTWSIFLAQYVIIIVVVQAAKWLLLHWYYVAACRRVACIATQLRTWDAEHLTTVSVANWRGLRSQLEQHRINRLEQLRFGRSPTDYLANLESQFF